MCDARTKYRWGTESSGVDREVRRSRFDDVKPLRVIADALRVTAKQGRSAPVRAASSLRWGAFVVLLLGGALCQQALRWGWSGPASVLAAVGLGCLAVLCIEAAGSAVRRQDGARREVLLSDCNDAVLVVRDTCVVETLGRTETALGVPAPTLIGLPLLEAVPALDSHRLSEAVIHAVGHREGSASIAGLALLELPATGERFVDVTIRDHSTDRSVRGLIVTVSDATERFRAERALASASGADLESGLPNRERIVELLDMSLHRARRRGDHVAVLVVGIDHHDSLVDGFDESARAAIMREVARRLRTTVRVEDPVGRIAADQFTIVLGGLDPRIGRAFALDVADRVARLIGEPFEVPGVRLTLSVSVGAAHRSQGAVEPSANELLTTAEDSLTQVRENTDRWKNTSPA